MITFTLVRHGESTDNLKGIWAGWKDAPLSNHGLNQAKAAGQYFANFPITHIYASPLKRALTTAEQIQKAQTQAPPPPLTITPLIREQHFGEAEGHPWAPALTKDNSEPPDPNTSSNERGRLGVINPKNGKKEYPVQVGRTAKFPAGESLVDVSQRTGEAFDEFVMPHVRNSVGKPLGEVNVVFVSHGIAISECIGAVLKRAVNGAGADPKRWTGLKNTAWNRLVIGMEGETLEYDPSRLPTPVHDVLAVEGTEVQMAEEPKDQGEKMADVAEGSNPPNGGSTEKDASAPKKEIVARVVAVNQHDHLDGIVRQKGGIGSSAHDDRQKAITEFFGGGGNAAAAAKSPGPGSPDSMDLDPASPGSRM